MNARMVYTLALALALALPLGAEERPCADPDPFATALAEIGLTRETLTFDYADMANYGGDKYALPLFYTLHSSPFKVETYAKVFRRQLLEDCSHLNPLLSFGSRRLNEGIRRGLVASPLEKLEPLLAREEPLYESIRALEVFYGRPLSRRVDSRLRQGAAQVPLKIQKPAAAIIYTAMDSLHYRDHALEEAAREFDLAEMYRKIQDLFTEEDIVDLDIERFIDRVDLKYLFTHSQDLAMAVDHAADSLSGIEVAGAFEFEWETAVGKIVLRDSRDHTYGPDDYLLIIDAGGNDTYAAAAVTRSPGNWISILVDAGGDDTYGTDETDGPAFGTGILGYGYLVDLGGNDTYKAGNLSQGVGLFGVGALLDLSGEDTYEGYMLTQGAGVFGIGAVSDLSGNDRYHCFQQGQGFGFTKGFGLLIDSSGTDSYIAEDSIIVFPSPQTAEHNANLAQGVGFGKRADFVDGHSWGGGIGFLIDGGGDDHYSAGLFAQGCAYWYAIGLLSDVSGNDLYDGIWYVQGSGAHFGLGVLLESAGNDVFNAETNMAQGAGHDFTLGFLIEEDGNDIYNAPNLSLGGGNANGIGMFWDKRGDDRYNCTAGTTMGRGNTAGRGRLRDYMNTIGLFLDTGGNDEYPLAYPDSVRLFENNSLWTRPGLDTERPLETERGVGYDCEWAETP